MARPQRRGSTGSAPPPVVIAGALGDPTEADPLEVAFRVEDDTVRLTAGDTELGAWSQDEVRMARIDGDTWYFEAEGDRLPFRPVRPAVLEASGLVARPPAPARRRSRFRKRSTSGEATPVPDEVEPVSAPRRRVRRRLPSIRVPRRSERRRAAGEGSPRASVWLRTVDMARHRGLFGLDRLPVDEEHRDGDHEHTWNHRAAGSGLAQHLCTICGAVRR